MGSVSTAPDFVLDCHCIHYAIHDWVTLQGIIPIGPLCIRLEMKEAACNRWLEPYTIYRQAGLVRFFLGICGII